MARTTPKDEGLVVAIDSLVVGDFVIPRGWRLRPSHPAVKAAPSAFRPADWPDDELEQARRDVIANARGSGTDER